MKHLLPGDEVLADRAFNVGDSVAAMGAILRIPPFTKGKKQLSKKEVDTFRQLSRVRIHVERIISQLRRKYTILAETVPVNYLSSCTDNSSLSTLDKIAVICCSLCNICDSITA